MIQGNGELFDDLDTLERFARALETLLSLVIVCRDGGTQTVNRGQKGEVFKLQAFVVNQGIGPAVREMELSLLHTD